MFVQKRGNLRLEHLFENLNPEQQEAVTATEGYIRVIAGAGSGKTRALARRFAYLVNELGILPGNILCVTFTNKSANEMRQRIHQLTGDSDTGYINTFHGFCVSVLQEDIYALGYPKNFLVLDNADIDEMLKIIYEERHLTQRDMTFAQARDMFEMRKCVDEPDYYKKIITLPTDELKKLYDDAADCKDILFYGYLYQQKKCFGLDYNDLIKFTLYLFSINDEIRLKWQKRLEYIMIDEFQDIDALQYKLMEVLCGYHGNLFVVGDPDQTIYSWRGARVGYLLDFARAFPNAQTIMMNRNYRSTPQVLHAVNALISANTERIPKDLVPVRGDGAPVVCHLGETQEQESAFIAAQIQSLHRDGLPYGDVTILYRAHYQTRTVEAALQKAKIPYRIYSGVPFYARKEIRDAIAYLRLIGFQDDLSFRRIANVPKRNIGERRMAFLSGYAEQHGTTLYQALCSNLDNPLIRTTGGPELVKLVEHFSAESSEMPISELLTAVLHESGYESMLRTEGSQERLDNLAEFKQSIYEYETTCGEETTLESYLAHLALFTGADADAEGDRVKLMTIHTAKGLEFPCVFLCGMNEGIFPSRKIRSRRQMEEERRLCLVAMTRAEDRLFLTAGGGRNFDGSARFPSRFLLDIPAELLQFTAPPSEGLLEETRAYIAWHDRYFTDVPEDGTFSVGQQVEHPVFGRGTVLEVDRDRNAYAIQFDDLDTVRKITFRAALTPIEEAEPE